MPPDSIQQAVPPGESTAYDTLWGEAQNVPHATSGLESVMLSQDKIYVVLAVVLIIWLGIVAFLFWNDRQLRRLERTIETGIAEENRETGS